jgi:uncharacterized protein
MMNSGRGRARLQDARIGCSALSAGGSRSSGVTGESYASPVHPNEALIRDAYMAMTAGDGKTLTALLTPTTQWIIAGHGPLAGTYTGPDEIFSLWKSIAAQTRGGLHLEVEDVLANDDRAVVLVVATGSRGARRLHERQVAVFEFNGGKVQTARFIYEDPDAYDRFWTD